MPAIVCPAGQVIVAVDDSDTDAQTGPAKADSSPVGDEISAPQPNMRSRVEIRMQPAESRQRARV
jgi:hypothetical protein